MSSPNQAQKRARMSTTPSSSPSSTPNQTPTRMPATSSSTNKCNFTHNQSPTNPEGAIPDGYCSCNEQLLLNGNSSDWLEFYTVRCTGCETHHGLKCYTVTENDHTDDTDNWLCNLCLTRIQFGKQVEWREAEVKKLLKEIKDLKEENDNLKMQNQKLRRVWPTIKDTWEMMQLEINSILPR